MLRFQISFNPIVRAQSKRQQPIDARGQLAIIRMVAIFLPKQQSLLFRGMTLE